MKYTWKPRLRETRTEVIRALLHPTSSGALCPLLLYSVILPRQSDLFLHLQGLSYAKDSTQYVSWTWTSLLKLSRMYPSIYRLDVPPHVLHGLTASSLLGPLPPQVQLSAVPGLLTVLRLLHS